MKEVLFKDKTRHLFFGLKELEELQTWTEESGGEIDMSKIGNIIRMCVMLLNAGARKVKDKEVLTKDSLMDLLDEDMEAFRQMLSLIAEVQEDFTKNMPKGDGEKKNSARQKK